MMKKTGKKAARKWVFILFLDDSGRRSAGQIRALAAEIAADRSWARGNVPGGRASC